MVYNMLMQIMWFCLYTSLANQNLQHSTISYLSNDVQGNTTHHKNYSYFWSLFNQPVSPELV